MAKRIVYFTSPFIFALSFFTTLRKRLRDDELGGSNFSHRFNEIKQKIIRVIRAIRGKNSATNYHKLPQTIHNRKHQFNPSKPNLHLF